MPRYDRIRSAASSVDGKRGLSIAMVAAAATALALGLTPGPARAEGRVAEPVSPGAAEEVVEVELQCPTFSWSPAPGANRHELSVFEIAEDDRSFEDARLAVSQALPGEASSWTPSGDDCLDSGVSYGWVVRAAEGEEPGPWSEPLLFRIRTAPSRDEVRRALETLRRWDERSPATTDAEIAPAREAFGREAAGGPSPSASALTGGAHLALHGDGTIVGNAFLYSCGAEATSTFYRDADGDNAGDASDSIQACQAPAGYVVDDGDCDDSLVTCDPENPSVSCGSGAHCIPTADGAGQCESGTGSGTQNSFCSSNADCAPTFLCTTTSEDTNPKCREFCTSSFDCFGDCVFFTDPVFVCGTQYGVCVQ